MVGEGQLALVEALDEVGLALVLAAAGGLAGPALPCEGHEPALMPGILEGRVVVLQHYLSEHAILALPAGLGEKGGEEGSLSTCLSFLALGLFCRTQHRPMESVSAEELPGEQGCHCK